MSFKEPDSRRGLTTAVVVVSLATIAAYILTRREELAAFQRLSMTVLLIALLCQFLSQLLWNGAMLLPLRTCMARLGYWELFMVRSGGYLVGYVLPVAGSLAVRVAYLRRRGLTYSDFTWATLTSNVLALSAAAGLAVFAVGALWMTTGTASAPVLGLTAGVSALGVLGLMVLRFLPGLAGQPLVHRWRWLSGMSSFKVSRRTMIWVLALSLVRHGFNFLTFGLLYESLSRAPREFLTGGLVYAITSPIRMVTITPGNLGVNEWAVAIVGRLLSFDLTTGLFVSLVFRAMSLIAQVLGGLLAGAWLALSGGPPEAPSMS